MTIHTIHPDTHTNGLADDCPRCDELAERPFDGLDDNNLDMLVRRIELGEDPRSMNEAQAMIKVRIVIAQAAKLDSLRLV